MERNYKEAMRYYLIAIEKGCEHSYRGIGELYEYGYGVEKDLVQALSWYKKGKEKGDFIAGLEAMRLAELIAWKKSQEQKKENAAPVRETKRADVKSVAADVAVGQAKDEAAAHRWFLKAAEQGNVAAQMNAGIDFARGTGTKKNIPEAIKWYKRAAENGNAEAEYLLAVIYMSGDGIAPDYPEAVRRFKNALRSEDKEIKKSAKEALSLLAKEGSR